MMGEPFSKCAAERAMPNAEDHNGFRLDAMADDIRPHGHKLASLAARPVALRESLQAFTCRHKTGHKTRRRNGRILPIVDPDRIKVAPGAGCPKHIASGRRSGVPSDEVRRFAPSELNVLSRRGKRLAANLRRAEFIASSPRLNPSQNRLGADDPARPVVGRGLGVRRVVSVRLGRRGIAREH